MGKRLLAYVIDSAAYMIIGGGFVIGGLLPLLAGITDPGRSQVSPSPLLAVGWLLVVAFGIVQWWLLGTRGFTVGKRLVGLRVLSAVDGRPIGMGRAFLRLLIPAAGSLAAGIGQPLVYASPFFDSSGRRQGWHDKVAGSMVFDVTVGVDPSAAPGASGPDAARRIDGLLRAQGVPPVAPGAPAPGAPAPVGPPRGEQEAYLNRPAGVPGPPPPPPAPLLPPRVPPTPAGGIPVAGSAPVPPPAPAPATRKRRLMPFPRKITPRSTRDSERS
ncbi:RDD family protein, partial [Actinotalea subterranea]|uniref:RDD family protein n=1 Tax=Actinotalea subterranea TaxID=2607497 RepID=UPI00165E41CE